ncbi:prepilin peptidase [Bifidobacterium oedipodis]|uniref:Peptidase A24 n=1 Tax=Bifidobacterium oedipodis TaxID=2675322 RepID=A0A7Y0HS55_9BIFI|nr:prepilin peptidase [Bifidobacterium sp. DSM 109957]NMM93228.1 peptidase A24 [Bifidobacterium sp. DSM 109957]
MPYLFCLPGLLCGLALSIEDVRHRRVPLTWVALGALCQLVADLAYGIISNNLFALVQALLFTALCCLLQLALALIVPKTLGFGDVTALIPLGLAVGLFGLFAVVVWWLAMGLLGLAWIVLWLRFDPQHTSAYAGKVPYVPALLIGAIIAITVANVIS